MAKADRDALKVDVASYVSSSAGAAAHTATPDSDVSILTSSRTAGVAVRIEFIVGTLLAVSLVQARADRNALVGVLISNVSSFADTSGRAQTARSLVEVFIEASVVTLRHVIRKLFAHGTALVAKS